MSDGLPATGRLRAALDSRAFKVWGAAALLLNVAATVSLVLHDTSEYDRLQDFWLFNSIMIVPILACVARALAGGPRRAAAVWLGLAITSYGAGNVIFLGWTQFQAEPAVPSPADLAYLAFYPFAAAAVVCLLRQEESDLTRGRWLDGALGAAGAATALAVVISPQFTGSGDALGTLLVGAAFSIGDLLLIAMIFGTVAVRGLKGSSMWLWLGIGLATFCIADIAYAMRVASGTFVVGTLWSSLWVIGVTIAAFSVWLPERPGQVGSSRSTWMLGIPLIATGIAVVGLVSSSIAQLPIIVVFLATLTLCLAGGRTVIAFRQVRRLTDAHRQATTDELTGLGNRRALLEFGEARIASALPADRVVLMLIDIDGFKLVNDSLGLAAGDQLLIETGRRLAARVQHPDFVVRLGGNEFALITTLAPDGDERRCAEETLDLVREEVAIGGARLRVEASAGVAEAPVGDRVISELLRRADIAMHAAKASAGHVELYDPQLDARNRERMATIQDLDGAIVRDEFLLHFQPKIDVVSGRVVGAEALVRWQHPSRGLLYPDSFLPLVESSGLMGAVTQRVLQAAVAQIAGWRASGMNISVAVNLSASDLLDERLTDRIVDLLARHSVPVEALELEITESVLMTDPERARRVLERLRTLGLRIAVDDYGTGYCSLAYLTDLPFDELKIDRSFVAKMAGDRRSVAIVRSTIDLAHVLGLDVVGEGVENPRALGMLAAFGCDFAQGFHISRPLTAEAFAAFAAVEHADMRHVAQRSPSTVA